MDELAQVLNSARTGPAKLDVSLHHVINSFATPLLYVFHLQTVGEEGNLEDDIEAGQLHIAVVANQPVELQVQATLGFVALLLERQRHVARVRDSDEGIVDLDVKMGSADAAGESELIDRLRYGWRATANMTASKAEELGFPLNVNYRPAFLVSAEAAQRRLPLLRRIYNEMDDVRGHIDRIVGTIAGGESRISGASESVRLALQQRTMVAGIMEYFSQATRDSVALGNGYVKFTDTEPLGAYNLRPEVIEPLGSGRARDLRTGVEFSDVLHFTGFQQPGTQVGLGICELMVAYLRQRDVVQDAIRNMQAFIDAHPEASKVVAGYTALAERQEQLRQKRVSELFGWWTDHVSLPSEDLYFEGQSRL